MIGGYFWGHPWSWRHNVTVLIEDSEHALIKPVFGDMSDFRIQEEIYQFKEEPYSREKLRVLLSLDVERSDEPMPKSPLRRTCGDYAISWVQSVGEGRVFYTNLGHNHHIYTDPLLLKHFLAGIQFATGDIEADTSPSASLEK
jgi:type 1 glutamine amidotransferase